MKFKQTIKPMADETADFSKCYIDEWEGRKCISCKQHGAMNCVKSEDKESVYRCLQAINLSTGKTDYPCYAGCISYFTEEVIK